MFFSPLGDLARRLSSLVLLTSMVMLCFNAIFAEHALCSPLVVAHGLAVRLVVGLNVLRFAVSHASVLSWIRKLVHDSLVPSPGPPLKQTEATI